MEEQLGELLRSERRLRVSVARLGEPIAGYVTDQVWQSDPNVFYLEADDGEVHAIE